MVFYKLITEVLFKIGEGEKVSSECGINTSGISLTKLIPLIKDVVLGKIPMNKKGLEKALEGYSLNENFLDELGELINEDIADLRGKRDKLAHRIRYTKQKGGDVSALEIASFIFIFSRKLMHSVICFIYFVFFFIIIISELIESEARRVIHSLPIVSGILSTSPCKLFQNHFNRAR